MMNNTNAVIDFFMGANSPNGFYSFYDELREPKMDSRSFLIKGGAGTGKSGIMKRIAATFGGKDKLIERIHCSSDPNSLDGVILHTGKCSVVDATPPHVIEPTYPGGFETVINLCEYFDEDKMASRLSNTVTYQNSNNACHKKCRGFIKCADILLKDNYYFVESCTDFNKIAALTTRICQTEFKSDSNPIEHKRLLSAVTNEGIKTYENTVLALCDRVYLIKDDYGVSSSYLLAKIRDYALSKGYEIFGCYCPLTPDCKLEHLLIPALSLGFITQNRFNEFPNVIPAKVINFTRFTDLEKLKGKKQYLSFNRKAAAELISASVEVLREAKAIHDKLELQYTDAVNFSRVNEKTQQVLDKIASRYK